MKKKHILFSLFLAGLSTVVILILAKGLMLDASKVPSALLGKPAFNFSVPILQGKEILQNQEQITLSSLNGKPLILNFWASWCVSCREEARLMEEFWQKHKNEIYFFGIAIQDTKAAAMEFAKYYGKTYPLGLDTDGKAAIDYGVYGVPETFFINKDGIVLHKEAGPVDAHILEDNLRKIL